jgi:hypothetical protein
MPVEERQMTAEGAPEAAREGGEPVNDLQIQALRNSEGQFLRGQPGNPAGKPPAPAIGQR